MIDTILEFWCELFSGHKFPRHLDEEITRGNAVTLTCRRCGVQWTWRGGVPVSKAKGHVPRSLRIL